MGSSKKNQKETKGKSKDLSPSNDQLGENASLESSPDYDNLGKKSSKKG